MSASGASRNAATSSSAGSTSANPRSRARFSDPIGATPRPSDERLGPPLEHRGGVVGEEAEVRRIELLLLLGGVQDARSHLPGELDLVRRGRIEVRLAELGELLRVEQ